METALLGNEVNGERFPTAAQIDPYYRENDSNLDPNSKPILISIETLQIVHNDIPLLVLRR